jgi:hypothetical protein
VSIDALPRSSTRSAHRPTTEPDFAVPDTVEELLREAHPKPLVPPIKEVGRNAFGRLVDAFSSPGVDLPVIEPAPIRVVTEEPAKVSAPRRVEVSGNPICQMVARLVPIGDGVDRHDEYRRLTNAA